MNLLTKNSLIRFRSKLLEDIDHGMTNPERIKKTCSPLSPNCAIALINESCGKKEAPKQQWKRHTLKAAIPRSSSKFSIRKVFLICCGNLVHKSDKNCLHLTRVANNSSNL